jgi:hypothetical protein
MVVVVDVDVVEYDDTTASLLGKREKTRKQSNNGEVQVGMDILIATFEQERSFLLMTAFMMAIICVVCVVCSCMYLL